MILKILFTSLSLAFYIITANAQNSMSVRDFMGNEQSIPLTHADSDIVVVFANSNKCLKCVEEIGQEMNVIADKNWPVKLYVLIRVGNSPILKREQMDLFQLNENARLKTTFFFDIDNDSTIGLESPDQVKGNFKTYRMFQTPGVLLIKRSTKQPKIIVYRYSNLFYEDSKDIKIHLTSVLGRK